ncbi:hypothetical protein [Solibacillus isronensis]|uniref:hypothetical protein n=1 Tax=Solibacillus isronensis TaxID=412383 RepID=UPI0039A1EA5D
MGKCPICKLPTVEQSYWDSDIHMTVEEYEICKDGCKQYNYEYAYGNWMMELGSTMLIGWHGDSKTRRSKRQFIYKRKLKQLRKAYRKTKGN